MAKLRSPILSHAAVGSLGPITIWSTPGGPSGRSRITPCDTRSPTQRLYQYTCFERISTFWGSLEPDTQTLWESSAAQIHLPSYFRQFLQPTGRQFFFHLNLALCSAGLPLIQSPPPTHQSSYLPSLSVNWTSSGAQLTFSPAIPTGGALIIYQRRNLTGANLKRKKSRLSEILYDDSLSPVLITPPADDGAGPGIQPAIWLGSLIHIFIKSIDKYGFSSLNMFFKIQATS
jgi:hypothetical protein